MDWHLDTTGLGAKIVAALGEPARHDERHARHVDELAHTPGFARLRDDIISRAEPAKSHRVLDLGAGTGLLALAVAPNVSHVTAVDVSPAACRMLEARARELAITNLSVLVADARNLPITSSSIDLALSNYCLHHLSDADKLVALHELARVLRPEGQLVLGDMMFKVGLRTKRDRRILAHLGLSMLRSHPAGVLRLLRNIVRTLIAPSERPASVEWWEQALRDTGYTNVRVVALKHEGGIACAQRA